VTGNDYMQAIETKGGKKDQRRKNKNSKDLERIGEVAEWPIAPLC
jgi:hypothetical protein